MSARRRRHFAYRLGLAALFMGLPVAGLHASDRQDPQAPRILLDQPLRAVEYQLSRLTNDELARVERRPGDVRYRPVYMALLTRGGLARDVRDEAVAALVAMDKSSRVRVLIEALGKVTAEDAQAADRVLALLFAEPAPALEKDRDALAAVTTASASPPFALEGAYGALMIADGSPSEAWTAAAGRDGHLVELVRSVPHLPAAELRRQLYEPVAALVGKSDDPAVRAEAIGVLGWTRPDTAAFELLAREIVSPGAASSEATRAAAVRSLQRIPLAAWPPAGVEPPARALVTWLAAVPPGDRTEPAAIDAVQLGQALAAALPVERGRALAGELRALGVQVVRIQTLTEQMRFDLNWFVVEAGKPAQIVLTNVDVMPHNLVIGQPGSLQEIGTAGGAMPMPADPAAKPFVPDSPLVVAATNLLTEGITARLGFTAPTKPGEYIFVCTFPGHWVRMYGVMLVVPSLEAWQSKPTTPLDPMTKQPFTAQRNAAEPGK